MSRRLNINNMPHKTKALGRKIKKIRREGIRQKQAVGKAFGILKKKHK